MRISVCSDIHLEFGNIVLTNDEKAEVLILGGDICIAKDVRVKDDYGLMGKNDNNKIHSFFQNVCREFPHVVYIMGNHEHYHGDFATSVGNLRSHLGYLDNLHILDKETFDLDDVTFIAGTLWTDMNREDPMTLNAIRGYMNDYRTIMNSNSDPVHYSTPIYAVKEDGSYDFDNVVSKEFHTRPAKFTPEDSVADHKAMLEFIDTVITGDLILGDVSRKYVVVGHHAPSKLSTKPQYEDDVMVNGAYSSDLIQFIMDRPQIKTWTHGHTHHEFDYMIGTTRIVCNPRGYDAYEHQADIFKLKTIDV
jgi:predicted phosphodiesterase